MERKRSGRRYYNKRKKTWTQQCKDYLRQFIAFLFSNIGIICLVVGYTIAGAFMFIFIEGAPGNAIAVIDRVGANRSGTADRIWDMVCCNAYCEDEWKREVQVHLRSFQSHVIEAVRNFSYEGPNKQMTRWSFSGSFLYSLSVITTIGECRVDPACPTNPLEWISWLGWGRRGVLEAVRLVGNLPKESTISPEIRTFRSV